MKSDELNEEELRLVQELRARREAAAQKEEEERKRQERSKSLEEEFIKVQAETLKLIHAELDLAEVALHKAVKISEVYGIPFVSNVISDFADRRYHPKSFSKKWGELDEEFLEDLEIYDRGGGWESWNSSSLNC